MPAPFPMDKARKNRVIAVDQGTSSTRGYLLDETGAGRVVCTRQHRQIYPQSGWVEHDPEALLNDVKDCIKAAGKVDAIGLDNQGESCLAWYADTGEALSNVLVWQDRRTEAAVARLKQEGAEALTLAKAGLPLDPYFSASKLAWILANNPEAKAAHKRGKLRLGTTDAFFIERLTGQFVTDPSTASRTSLFNLETGQWDQELCDLFGVPLETLPEIKPTMGLFGTVSIDGHSAPLMASVVDQQAALYGHGCRRAGDAKITFGTGAFALALTGKTLINRPEKGLLPTIAWQSSGHTPEFALDGGVYSAASALNWAKTLGLFKEFSEINTFSAPPAITRNLAFVPALTGLGCPYWDGSAAGMWLGMTLDTSATDMVQAILEGVALRAAQVVDAMEEVAPLGQTISIDGGMSANPWFCQFLADVLQKSVTVQTSAELSALGTALMAGAKTDTHGTAPFQTFTPRENMSEFKPVFAEAVRRSRGWKGNG